MHHKQCSWQARSSFTGFPAMKGRSTTLPSKRFQTAHIMTRAIVVAPCERTSRGTVARQGPVSRQSSRVPLPPSSPVLRRWGEQPGQRALMGQAGWARRGLCTRARTTAPRRKPRRAASICSQLGSQPHPTRCPGCTTTPARLRHSRLLGRDRPNGCRALAAPHQAIDLLRALRRHTVQG